MEIVKHNDPEGPIVPKGSYVSVHYTGKLASNGKVFDCSRQRGEPLQFQVGVGQVIKGWDEGICQLKLKQKATITCPPEYGYGKRGAGSDIPPNATLIFDVEVVDFTMQMESGWLENGIRWGLYLLCFLAMFEKTLAPPSLYQPAPHGLS